MNNLKIIKIKNLTSIFSFKNWIRESTGYFIDKDISKENMLIIIDYLTNVFENVKIKNRMPWLETLKKLKNKIERI